MPFCTNCGTEVGENEKFCTNCGNPLEGDQKIAEKSTVQVSSPKVTTSSKKTNKLIWVAIPVVFVTVAAAYYLWQSNKVELVDNNPEEIVHLEDEKTDTGNEKEEIEKLFVDKNLEEAVRIAVGKTDGNIKKEDVEGLVELDASGQSIESIEGIEKLTSIQILSLSGNKITDITPLEQLANLQELYINTEMSDYSPALKVINELKEKGVEIEFINSKGNTVGNIVNGGYAAQQGDWIYYRNDYGYIYKIKTDGSNLTKIIDNESSYINVVGDWIFYRNNSDSGSIYKIKTDGSNRTKINDDYSNFINVVGDWIYYTNGYPFGSVYKIKTDGSNRTDLNAQWPWYVNVVGDWIYYSERGYGIYKIKTDGSNLTKLTDDRAIYLNVIGDWIYFTNGTFDSVGSVYKIKTDGSNQTKITESSIYHYDSADYINVVGDWIYFVDFDKHISKIKTDGSNETEVNDDDSRNINVVGDWIYYRKLDNSFDASGLYKIKTNGTERQTIASVKPPKEVVLSKEERENFNIFFSNYSEVYLKPFKKDQVPNSELINFGFFHNYINVFKRFKVIDDYYLLPAEYVEESVYKYFGVNVKHESVDQYLTYKNGNYYFPVADGESRPFSHIDKLFDLGNDNYLAYISVYKEKTFESVSMKEGLNYLYKNFEDWDEKYKDEIELIQKMKATIKKVTENGKTRYILIDYLEQ